MCSGDDSDIEARDLYVVWSVNEETYVHGCDRARSLSIGNRSSDRDDPTGLELSPVGRSSLL